MQTKKNQIILILLLLSASISSQNVIFSEDFVKPMKWKTSNMANGSMTFEKEGSESVMKLEALPETMFQAVLKIPAIQSTTKKVFMEYDFYLTEKFNGHVSFGTKPNRLAVNSDGIKGLRLVGEAITIADGAKFMTLTPNAWHKMQIVYDLQSKIAKFSLNGKETKEVDLNMQPDKMYVFSPTEISIKVFKGGIIKVKAIKILEL